MKFSKKNILFKMVFIILMTFICFNAHNVMAEDKNQCTYKFEDTKNTNKFEFYFNDNNELKVKYANYYAWNYYVITGNTIGEMNDLIVNKQVLYCPNIVYVINNNDSSATRFGSKKYVDKLKNNEWKDKSNVYIFEAELSLSDSKNAYGYDLTKNPGVCIHTSNNTEFAGIYQSAKELKKAVVYSSENDTRATRINNYINRTINKAFCDQEELKVLSDAITNWGTVVSKDPSANKSQKDKAQEQTENTTKNLENIISNMQNSANISMPNDNPVQNTCEGLIDEDLKRVIDIVLNAVRIVVPILLIVLIAVDFGQVVISNDKDAMPKAISKAIKRGIAAIVIFFIPFLVDLIIDWLNTYSGINGAANCIK